MEELWKIANSFRFWVCTELRNLVAGERISLQGDYLFIIDSKPCFIVMVDTLGAWSVALSLDESPPFVVEAGCPIMVNLEGLHNCISYSARTTITTNSHTLQKLLLGKLKAKVAFLTSQVELSGDLSAFLKLVSILKKKGVKPVQNLEEVQQL